MPRLIDKFFEAKRLRQGGYSLKEISEKLNIAKSTASVWLRDVRLSQKALNRLEQRGLLGRIKASETRRRKREKLERLFKKKSLKIVESAKMTKGQLKILCSLLFWCEGTKDTRGGVYFVNSDPSLIKMFLKLLRLSFDIQEKKFRVLLHLHGYHSPQKQILYWSRVTNIPISQFTKPYQKPHTGKRVKENYPGCVNIKYFDSKLAKELYFLAQETLNKYGRVR